MKKINVLAIVLFVILATYTISIIIPLIWTIFTSFKTIDEFEFLHNVMGLPQQFTLENYLVIIKDFVIEPSSIEGTSRTLYIEDMLLNSVIYVAGASFCATFMPFFTAYLNTKFNGKLASIMNTTVLITMALPIVGSYPSEIQLLTSMGLYDTFWGLFLMKSSFLGVYYLVFCANFKSLGKDYVEAAEIDGASEFRVMLKIMFPLAKTSFFTILLMQIILFWNEYQGPMLYMPTKATLSYGLFSLAHGVGNNSLAHVPTHMAGVIMVILPIMILFLVFRKKIMNNINIGGVKE